MASFNMAGGVIALLLTGAVAQALPDGALTLPQQAQIIDQLSQNVLEEVLPPYEANASTVRTHIGREKATTHNNRRNSCGVASILRRSRRDHFTSTARSSMR